MTLSLGARPKRRASMRGRYVGRPVPRLYDGPFLTGSAGYLDDLRLPEQQHLLFVRSPYPRARIRGIDARRAEAGGGVRCITANDVRGIAPPPQQQVFARQRPARWEALAAHETHFVGEPVAAVIAATRGNAEDAAEILAVDYEALPFVMDAEAALAPDAPRVFGEWGDNVVANGRMESGDCEAALQRADVVIEERFRWRRQAGIPIEPRGVVARFDGEQLTIWLSGQAAHRVQRWLAVALNLAPDRVRVIIPAVGGAFGVKGPLYPETAVTAWAAMQLRCPVKWVETRGEHLVAAVQGRDQVHDVRVGADGSGRIRAFEDRFLVDLGAYTYAHSLTAWTTATLLHGNYRIPAFRFDITCVTTNKTPLGPVRGAGRPEATFVIERVMDRLAQRLSVDPAYVRAHNFIPSTAFPYEPGTGLTYDSGHYPQLLRRLLRLSGYQRWRRGQRRLRRRGMLRGVGLACYVERTGAGPATGGRNDESAVLTVAPSGRVALVTGACPQGQGLETVLAQICADELGVPVSAIDVRAGDTAEIGYGVGTFGSRSAVVAGSAVTLAARDLRRQMLRVAASLMRVDENSVAYRRGRFYAHGKTKKSVPWEVVARQATGRCRSEVVFAPPAYCISSAAHLAVVDVDASTGGVQVIAYYAIEDCGTVLNPLIVHGQTHGGILHGVGSAFYEEVPFDELGQPVAGGLLYYAVPNSPAVPQIRLATQETPSPLTPLGMKGTGEGGALGAPAALANAVEDALRPYHVKITELPLTPERLWTLLQQANGGQPSARNRPN